MQQLKQVLNLARVGLLVAVLLLCISGCDSLSSRGIEPGAKAPNVVGLDLTNKSFELSSLQGKVVLLNFWATWCGPCVAELPALQKLHDALKDKGFSVLAVAVDDTVDDVKEYRERYQLSFPILVDTDGKSKHLYKIQGVPESFLLDRNQHIIFVTDPESGEPVTKIIGPREWETPQVVNLVSELLKSK